MIIYGGELGENLIKETQNIISDQNELPGLSVLTGGSVSRVLALTAGSCYSGNLTCWFMQTYIQY